jgi:uncharacterized protein involved in exopolysaccharide biosynthesis
MSEAPLESYKGGQTEPTNDEIDLKELFLITYNAKWLISSITGTAAMISVLFALWLPNIYTASALLAPAEASGGGLSGLMKQYGGLASLAGVSLPGNDDMSQTQLGIQLMQSRAFIGDFVERRDILPELMAAKSWDMELDLLTYDADDFVEETGQWIRVVKPPFESRPSLLEAHEEFMKIMEVSEDKNTGYVSVSIDHKSPRIAAQWVTWLIEDINTTVKRQDVAEATKSIEYLKQQVANTALADLHAMFFELIQSQTETMMLAEVRPEYVFKTIDPAVPPEEESKPNRLLICILGVLFGTVLAFSWVFIKHYLYFSEKK